jgi:hypothetical protein
MDHLIHMGQVFDDELMGQEPLVDDPDRFGIFVKPDGSHLFSVYIHG